MVKVKEHSASCFVTMSFRIIWPIMKPVTLVLLQDYFYRQRHFLKKDFSLLELYTVYRLNTSDAFWYPFSVDSIVL